MDNFLRWMHKAMIVRRITWAWALWMSTFITIEVWTWIKEMDKVDVATATIAAAILTPVLGLTGWIIKNYAVNPYLDKLPEDDK